MSKFGPIILLPSLLSPVSLGLTGSSGFSDLVRAL